MLGQAATPGCTKEACAFRDAYGKFKDAGAHVFGISSDSVQANGDFAKVGEQNQISRAFAAYDSQFLLSKPNVNLQSLGSSSLSLMSPVLVP